MAHARLHRVLSVEWNSFLKRASPIDSRMEYLLDAGLKGHLADAVMRATDPESFLAAKDVLLTRTKVSRKHAQAVWDAAAQHFYGVPADRVRSREAFVRVMEAHSRVLPNAWQLILHEAADVEDLKEFMDNMKAGESHFWAWGGAAKILTLLLAASLPTTTDLGWTTQFALKVQLAAMVRGLAEQAGGHAGVLDLADSLKQFAYAPSPDGVAATSLQRMGGRRWGWDSWLPPRSFEKAVAESTSLKDWRFFIQSTAGATHTGPGASKNWLGIGLWPRPSSS